MPNVNLTPPFIPMSMEEVKALGWDGIDVLLITGDAYVDHPSFGAALIGRLLLSQGWKVGIVAQPDWKSPDSLKKMGRPRLACAVTSGNLDSMVNIYTAARRLRKDDAYSPGGVTGKRPPSALTVYCQLARAAFPGCFVLAGGIEASMRRVAHYDYWKDKICPSVLLDSKADIIVYGMGEKAAREILTRLENNQPMDGVRGTARLLGSKASKSFDPQLKYSPLPSFEEHQADRLALLRSAVVVEREMNPYCGRGLFQWHGDRLLVVEPPQEPLSSDEMDKVYELPFSGAPHPSYKEKIPAFETVKDSIVCVRGCPGGCSFCGLVLHQGKLVTSRGMSSVLGEIERLKKRKCFNGNISDLGGAAGNIYGQSVRNFEFCRICRRPSCLFPSICENYKITEDPLLELLRKAAASPGVRHVFVNSGMRVDLAVRQKRLMAHIIHNNVSGHMKVAPEHLHPDVLRLMRKNPASDFYEFLDIFHNESRKAGKEQYLIPLFISNFPGCTEREMKVVDDFLKARNWSPQQVQDYIPLPMTMAAAIYYCGETPDGVKVAVNRGLKERRPQIKTLKGKHFPDRGGFKGRKGR